MMKYVMVYAMLIVVYVVYVYVMMMVYVYVVCYASLVDALEIRYPLYIYINNRFS